jgi:hypothetical protein
VRQLIRNIAYLFACIFSVYHSDHVGLQGGGNDQFFVVGEDIALPPPELSPENDAPLAANTTRGLFSDKSLRLGQVVVGCLKCWSNDNDLSERSYHFDEMRRWVVFQSTETHAEVFCSDDFNLPRGSCRLDSLEDAQYLQRQYANKVLGVGDCLAVQTISLDDLYRHTYFLSSADVLANSGELEPICCECRQECQPRDLSMCDGNYPFSFGRGFRCRRGVVCLDCRPLCFDEDLTFRGETMRRQKAQLDKPGHWYLCKHCRNPNVSAQDVSGIQIVPPNRYEGLITPGTPIMVNLLGRVEPYAAVEAQLETKKRAYVARCEAVGRSTVDASVIMLDAFRDLNMSDVMQRGVLKAFQELRDKHINDALPASLNALVKSGETVLPSAQEAPVTVITRRPTFNFLIYSPVCVCRLGQGGGRNKRTTKLFSDMKLKKDNLILTNAEQELFVHQACAVSGLCALVFWCIPENPTFSEEQQ